MRRAELEHAIRACADVIGRDGFLIIGSQAILGSFNEYELPPEATMSTEVDVCPVGDLDGSLATRLDGAIGEWSQFHETHGFYIQGVGRDTAVLPDGWRERVVPMSNERTRYATGTASIPSTGARPSWRRTAPTITPSSRP